MTNQVARQKPIRPMAICAIGLLCLWTAVLALPSPAMAQTPTATGTPNTSAQISNPADGAVLIGVVRITGTANNSAMQQYRLDFLALADPRGQWQTIAGGVAQQVTNGTLGQWDTTKVSDGAYQLRLRVTLRNGTVFDAVAHNLAVSNQQPTSLPSVPPPPTATSLPTAGPSPTPIIQQPPTATPNVAGPVVPATAVPPSADTNIATDSGSVTLSFAAMEGAACSGGLIAVIAFALGGAYLMLRARFRRAGR